MNNEEKKAGKMNEGKDILKQKSFGFVLRIIKIIKYLKEHKKIYFSFTKSSIE